IGTMEYRRFVSYNIVGGLLWAVGVTSAGFLLGNVIPDVDKYLLPIIIVIILVSVAPSAYHVLKEKETRDALLAQARRLLGQSPAR
ncbi:MAG: DedA family protein, partial [Anaerolineae bacterium]|nr:DedA family protein [Anaerolineae bacterium]